MARKYKIALHINIVCILFLFCILCSYLKFQKNIEIEPLVVVNNGLSINFRNGNQIKINNKTESFSFSVTNNNETSTYYYIELDNLNTNKDTIQYSLKEKNGMFEIDNGEVTNDNANLASYVEIEPGATHSFELTIHDANKLSLTADLDVETEETKEEYFANTILKNNKVKEETITKVGEEVATENEGLIMSTDDTGTSYYFRGNIENNYVSFADYLWRIVKINGDGTIKLILDDYIENSASFYETNSEKQLEEKMAYLDSKIYTMLESWYKLNLIKYENDIAAKKYCVDNSIGKIDEKTYYLANSRLLIDYSPIHNCLGSNYTSKIGLLTADEVVFAGASKNNDNTDYYLYVPDKSTSWWTMTPDKSDNNNVYFFEITQSGKLQVESVGSYYRGIRPVININKKTFVDGVGTIDEPYVIKE